MPIAAALAPSVPMNGPWMLPPPSYVMSAKRLTTPIVNTKENGDNSDRPTCLVFADIRPDQMARFRTLAGNSRRVLARRGSCLGRRRGGAELRELETEGALYRLDLLDGIVEAILAER